MDEQEQHSEQPQQFAWHPEYAGKTVDEVHQELASQIDADQRQHRLAMEGAEESEHDALASVMDLERRWGKYDFDWAEQDAGALAARVTAFELERERRHELISWADYRASVETTEEPASEITTSTELSTRMKGISLVILVAIIVLIVVSLTLL